MLRNVDTFELPGQAVHLGWADAMRKPIRNIVPDSKGMLHSKIYKVLHETIDETESTKMNELYAWLAHLGTLSTVLP